MSLLPYPSLFPLQCISHMSVRLSVHMSVRTSVCLFQPRVNPLLKHPAIVWAFIVVSGVNLLFSIGPYVWAGSVYISGKSLTSADTLELWSKTLDVKKGSVQATVLKGITDGGEETFEISSEDEAVSVMRNINPLKLVGNDVTFESVIKAENGLQATELTGLVGEDLIIRGNSTVTCESDFVVEDSHSIVSNNIQYAVRSLHRLDTL
jgi:hypothetical protein